MIGYANRKGQTGWCRTLMGGALALSTLTAGSNAMAADPVTLKMWALVNENYPEFIQTATDEFQKANPDINVELESIPNEAYKTAIQVALVGSEPPDIFFNWSGEDAARLARSGLALDITDLGAEEGNYRNMLSEAWQQAFSVDGRQYGIPVDAVSKYFYYNTRFFDEHELEVPATFDELLGLCGKVREIDSEMVPLPLGNSERWKLNHLITVINERVLGLDAVRADYALEAADDELFTNPDYEKAWDKVLAMQAADCFQDAPNATSPEVSRSLFSAEISPMIFCGTWCMSIFDKEGFTDYALFRFPPMTDGASDGSTNMVIPQGFQISAKSEHPAEAVKFASFLVTADMARLYAELRGAIPSNPEKVGEMDATEQFKWVAQDIGSLSESFSVLDVMLEAGVSEAYLDMGVEVLNGTKTPAEAMDVIRTAAVEGKKKLAAGQ